mmetsp:Transcript_51207/g.165896  ORF Transcript_51207/g.165896 Transcript_51207/m.165896 type:complete len:218 (+) Transcript_51207:211-864(+)
MQVRCSKLGCAEQCKQRQQRQCGQSKRAGGCCTFRGLLVGALTHRLFLLGLELCIRVIVLDGFRADPASLPAIAGDVGLCAPAHALVLGASGQLEDVAASLWRSIRDAKMTTLGASFHKVLVVAAIIGRKVFAFEARSSGRIAPRLDALAVLAPSGRSRRGLHIHLSWLAHSACQWAIPHEGRLIAAVRPIGACKALASATQPISDAPVVRANSTAI